MRRPVDDEDVSKLRSALCWAALVAALVLPFLSNARRASRAAEEELRAFTLTHQLKGAQARFHQTHHRYATLEELLASDLIERQALQSVEEDYLVRVGVSTTDPGFRWWASVSPRWIDDDRRAFGINQVGRVFMNHEGAVAFDPASCAPTSTAWVTSGYASPPQAELY